MNTTNTFARGAEPVYCRYEVLRNISTQQQKDSNIHVYVGVIKSDQLLEIPDDENVRRFLGKETSLSGKVQRDIHDSLEERAGLFSVLNGGITMVARALKSDNQKDQLMLINPSIINGSQTRGVLKIYHQNPDNPPVPVTVEIIVTTDDDTIAEISIARNVQTKVRDFSIAGRRGAYKDINKVLDTSKLPYRIVEDESDTDGLQPSLLLQLLFLFMPQELWREHLPKVSYEKRSIYSSTARWLNIYFDEIFEKKNKGDESGQELYDYVLQATLLVFPIYFEWQTSPEWKTRRHYTGIVKDDDGEIKKVSNGWIYPVLSAYSVWMKKDEKGKWFIDYPEGFSKKGLINFVRQFYTEDVNALGKNKAVYSSIESLCKSGSRLDQV